MPQRACRITRPHATTIRSRSRLKRYTPRCLLRCSRPWRNALTSRSSSERWTKRLRRRAADKGGAFVAQPRGVPNDGVPTPSVGRIANPSNQLADWQSALRPGPNTYSSRSAERPSARQLPAAMPNKSPSDNLPLARRSGVPPLKQCGGTPHLRAGAQRGDCRGPLVPGGAAGVAAARQSCPSSISAAGLAAAG